MSDTLNQRITDDMKSAMRAKDKPRLGIIRLIRAAIKQKEIDERISLDDTQVIAVLDKMMKQRRDSLAQYEKANRQDLVDQEAFELKIIQSYMPQPLSDSELADLIDSTLSATGASSIKDLGKVIGILKPKVQGRVDMRALSATLKQRLTH
ncbi:MAG: GatB/YqeY domain-containing protein [Thiomargarita sp.]|nr:GatB/YqeY domain-containing protein [Thiomargarita sp.]